LTHVTEPLYEHEVAEADAESVAPVLVLVLDPVLLFVSVLALAAEAVCCAPATKHVSRNVSGR
jgi:hypothetical protein